MTFISIIFLLFVHRAITLQCKTAWPSDCLFNSTCRYRDETCENRSKTSDNRGGSYCFTLAGEIGDSLIIRTMGCMYDQETTKPCKHQSQCSLKYINDQNKYLHCCCDQHFCNLNFTLDDSAIENPTTTIRTNERSCEGLLCQSISTIILSIIIIGLILFLIILLLISQKKLRKSFSKCRGYVGKRSSIKLNDNPEKGPFLINHDQTNQNNLQIHPNDISFGNILKTGRFSKIYQGKYHEENVAIKMLTSNDPNDQSIGSFQHEIFIYSLPFMNHFNILKYYGYSIFDDKYCLITSLSENGSLKDVLRSRLLTDENELLSILKQISEGVHYLHTDYRNRSGLTRPPIAHRDLKTDNILYMNSNQIVLSDFAMSTVIQQKHYQANQEQQIGTPRYMSPEILAGTIGCEETALLKCDVYALSIVFWEVLSRFSFTNTNVEYVQPFEEQLKKNHYNVNNPTVNEMYQITHLAEPFNRPLINQHWIDYNSKTINSIISLIKDSWEQSPESRIASGVVFRRITQLFK